MRHKKTCAVILLSLSLFVCSLSAQKVFDFALIDLDGRLIRLSDYWGDHVVLINFWATWCVPCRQEMKHLQKIYDRYKDQGFIVFSINIEGPETAAVVKSFISKYGYTFPVLQDSESKVVSMYNPRLLLPYNLVVDRGGRIRFVHQGYSPGDEDVLAEQIDSLLEESAMGEERRFSFHVNEALVYRDFSDIGYVDLYREGPKAQVLNQLDLTLSGKEFIFGARADASLGFTPLQGDFSLAKRYFEFHRENLSIRLGDFYHTLGRGLVFNLVKRFEAEGLEHVIDTTVDGARIQFRRGLFSIDVLGGWIDRPQEEVGNNKVRDKMAGGMMALKIGSYGEIRLNGLYSRLEEGARFGNKDVFMESLSLDIPHLLKKVKIYAEFSLSQKKRFNEDTYLYGHGLYLETGFYSGPFSLLFEFKDYEKMEFEYNRPPLLESEDLDILASQFDDSTMNIRGFAGRIDYLWPQMEMLFYGKFAYFLDSPRKKPLLGGVERKIWHLFGGMEKRFKTTGFLNALAGFRDEAGTAPYFSNTHGNTFHYQINCLYPLAPKWSIEADWKSKDFSGSFYDYAERRTFLSLHWSRRGILTLFYDWSTDPETLAIEDKKNWLAVQLEIKISSSNFVRIFAGSSKGSVKCSGGVCAFFPPFKGLRVEAIFQF